MTAGKCSPCLVKLARGFSCGLLLKRNQLEPSRNFHHCILLRDNAPISLGTGGELLKGFTDAKCNRYFQLTSKTCHKLSSDIKSSEIDSSMPAHIPLLYCLFFPYHKLDPSILLCLPSPACKWSVITIHLHASWDQ